MRFNRFFLLFFVSFFINGIVLAQIEPAKKDSTQVYKKLESFSGRSKFNKFMYRLIFKPVQKPQGKRTFEPDHNLLIRKPYSFFEGKIIRQINVITLDPFGYSVEDTTETTQNFLFDVGNKLHIKSQNITIRNLLLIHRNQIFDSLKVKESERLIRSMGYVSNVSFIIVNVPNSKDSVDINIRELDNWSLVPKAIISTSRNTVNMDDKNFMGFGHEFQNIFTRNFSSGINAFQTSYTIPNIRNTYINSILLYKIDGNHNFTRSLQFDRPFYSPLAIWAAGAYLSTQLSKDSLKVANSPYVPLNLKFDTQDYWAAKAFRVFKGNTEEERVTNLIVSLRYLRVRYFERPAEVYDPMHFYSNEDFYMAGVGISSRKYFQDKYVYNYGIIEDIPVGKVYCLTGGYQIKNNIIRRYLGLQYSIGNYHSWGYMSYNIVFGTFFHASKIEQGVVTGSINYFTHLFEIGKWKFRQFVKPQITIGITRTVNDSLTLKDGNGLDGFNSADLSGTKRLLFSLQTQSYAPWNLIGFHFGPYLVYSMGMLGSGAKGFRNSKLYSEIGLGVLIRNENLVISTFQFSISFYPSIPGAGLDVFKINAFNTTDFGLTDFVIGKPKTALFQ